MPETANVQEWVGRQRTEEDLASGERAERLRSLLSSALGGDGRATSDDHVLHPLGHWLQFAEDDVPLNDLGADGHAKLGGLMPPVALPRRMWAGSALTFHAPIRAGRELTRTTTIESIEEKTGGTGSLCFVVLRHEISAAGELAMTDRQTIVYREAAHAAPGSAARPPRNDSPVPTGWEWVRSVRPTEVMLFRYSALTFNSHRIHYDQPYATEVEGYPGIIVHGPLSATLLLQAFLADHEEEITGYVFRAKSPVFANEQIHLLGRRTGDTEHELRALAPDGTTAIEASVTTA